MRYSLATLILAVLLTASLMAVWFRREAWYAFGVPERVDGSVLNSLKYESPDGTRRIRLTWIDPAGYRIFSEENDEVLAFFPDTFFGKAHFVTDNEILLQPEVEGLLPTEAPFQRFRRRHPEWWWGHFHRPEVWASFALFLALIIHASRLRKQSRTG